MENRIVNALSITVLLSILLTPVSSAGVRGSGHAQPSDQPRATLPNAALAQVAPEPVNVPQPGSTAAGFRRGQRAPGPSVIQPHPGVPGQPLVDDPGRLTTQSNGTWRTYTNANTVEDLAVQGETVWAAASGGVVHWNRADGSYVKYTTYDGLASNDVRAVAIDEAGHKWFGTSVGVSKFDGTTWTTYTTDDGLADNSVYAIAVDRTGHKWFGTSVGVSKFDGTTWTTYTTDDGLANNTVYAIAVDRAGHKWFGTLAGGVSVFDGTTWKTYTTADGLASNRIHAIAVDRSDHKWFGTPGGGVSRFDGTTWTTYTMANGLARNLVYSIAIDGEGDKWFGTAGGGVSRFDGTTWTTYTTHDGLASDFVYAIAVEGAGHKWLGTGDGVSVFDGISWTTYTTGDGLASNDVRTIAVDKAGHEWFGTRWGGVSVFDGTTWKTYTTADGLAANTVHAIAIDAEGHKWFAAYNGVSRFDGTTWTTYTTDDGLAHNTVHAIAIDAEGHKWFGTYKSGVSRFDGSTWTTYTTFHGLSGNWVYAIAVDGAGHKWFGTDEGVSKFDGTTWTTYTTHDGLASPHVFAIAIDLADHKWFGGDIVGAFRSGVTKFDGTTWTTYTTNDGLASDTIYAIAVDGAGHKWFGTDKGVSKFDGTTWTTYTTHDGLADNRVRAIAIDHAGRKWFGTAGGVSELGTGGADGYTISGHVRDGEGDPIEGVVMSSLWFSPVETDENGYYEIIGLEAGTYGYGPSKDGYVFEPDFATVTVPPDATGQDFVGRPRVALRLLVLPLRWQNTQTAFDAVSQTQISLFLDEVPLGSCPERVVVDTLDVATQNFADFSCSRRNCAVNTVRTFVRDQLEVDPAEYDVVIGLAETSPCAPVMGCSNGTDTIWVTSQYDIVTAHELGHIYGLSDQYCSIQAGSTDARCNDGDIQGDGAASGDVNWLDANLPCDCPPDGSLDSEGSRCCNSGGRDCSTVNYGVCCLGNKNAAAGRSTMSYAGAPGPRGFDRNDLAHLNTVPALSCDTENNQAQSVLNHMTDNDSQRIIEVELLVQPNDSVTAQSISIGYGRPTSTSILDNLAGDYTLQVVDTLGGVAWSQSLALYFDYEGPVVLGVDYTGIVYDAVDVSFRITHSSAMRVLELYHAGDLIFSQALPSMQSVYLPLVLR